MTSLAKAYWQTLLAQAVGIGLGIGLLFLPAISIVSHYFLHRRALAIGIVATGSSAGGIVLPIMLNRLVASHGFEKAVQFSGYLVMGSLIIACALMRPRLPPNKKSAPKPSPKQIFSSVPYCFVVAGLFCVAWGLFFPIFYLQVYLHSRKVLGLKLTTPQVIAEIHHISPNLTQYLLAILNAASVFGRISPNFLADFCGALTTLTFMCFGAGVIVFSLFGAKTAGGIIAVAILYGFFSGAFVSLLSPALISLSSNFSEIGLRLGLGFLIVSVAALTGSPITGALLDKFGFYAPVIWSGVCVLSGAVFIGIAMIIQGRIKRTWKV